MKPAALRLTVAALLFVGWVGYLAFLAATTRNAIVLSRPQFLVSELDVIATHKGDDTFVIDEVLYPKDKDALKGKTVLVKNLVQCQTFSAKDGWHAAPPPEGQAYLLPLVSTGLPAAADQPETMNVAPIPASPGYPSAGPPRVYPDTPEVRREYGTIQKP